MFLLMLIVATSVCGDLLCDEENLKIDCDRPFYYFLIFDLVNPSKFSAALDENFS